MTKFYSILFLFIASCLYLFCTSNQPKNNETVWKHLSSAFGDLEVPNPGNQQTATAVFDVDKNGVNDFMITERTSSPSVVWYRYTEEGWQRYIVEDEPLRIEAGSAVNDIDQDGDLDVVFAGDGGNNKVWWWENPYPNYEAGTPWKRRKIKSDGANKHHDQLFADFDLDGADELVFWNQGKNTLYFAEIPTNPRETEPWELIPIYTYNSDSEPPQRGMYPNWKGKNEHEGLTKIDIDGDEKLDIVGAGRWFKHIEGTTFKPNIIDDTYAFSRSAAGQLIKGGRPEVVLVVGDGRAPMLMYQWKDARWNATTLIDTVQDGHSLAIVDFNGDGNLDIFNAEMRLGNNPGAKTRILLGDGQGGFKTKVIHTGFGLHESRITDLDGDGDFDILGKPYNWLAPRLDIWINDTK
jgi:hypothetical protein